MRTLAACLLAAGAAVALGSPGTLRGDAQLGRSAAPGDCDSLEPTVCMFPWPNDYWLRDNGAGDLVTQFGPDTFPADNSGIKVNPEGGWNGLSGFSPAGPIMTYFANVSVDNIPHFWDIADSVAPTSATLLLNLATGQPVAHWGELDHSSDGWEKEGDYARTLIFYPAARLEDGATYVMAMRNLTNSITGSSIRASPAFAALRDNSSSTDPSVNDRRAQYAKIFAAIEAVPGWGKSRGGLQLAWQFTVGTTTQWTGKFVSMRDDAFERLPPTGPKFRINSVVDNPDSNKARHVEGSVYVPWYLNTAEPGENVRLVLDPATGLPVFQEYQWVNFTFIVPAGVVANGSVPTPARVVQYGHGLFGSREEVESGYLQTEGGQNNFVYIATDWIGLSQYDVVDVALMIATNMTNFPMIPDRMHQGMLNALYAMRVAITGLASDPSTHFGGVGVIDTAKTGYYGNSQGGIMGAVYMGVSQDVTRGVLGVAGGPYGLLLPRSKDFEDLYVDIRLRFSNTLSRFALLGMFQILWNTMEPAGYLHAISRSPLPGTPAHRVIVHYGDGDAQVTWLGGQLIGRSVGASMFAGNADITEGNVTLFGFPFVANDAVLTSGNAIQGFNFQGIPTVPFTNVPPTKADTHEDPRRTQAAWSANGAFLNEGKIQNFCPGGVCKDLPVPSRAEGETRPLNWQPLLQGE